MGLDSPSRLLVTPDVVARGPCLRAVTGRAVRNVYSRGVVYKMVGG